MASVRETKVQVDVEINGQKAGQTLKAIKSDIKELYKELANLVPGTQQWIDKLGEIKDKTKLLDSANQAIKDITVSNEKAFRSFGKLAEGIVGAFNVAKLLPFGKAQDDIAKASEVAQQVIAASLSVRAVAEGLVEGRLAARLVLEKAAALQEGILAGITAAYGTVVGVLSGEISLATVAQTAWNAVMAINPIGALVVAVAALAAGIVWLTSRTDEASKAEQRHSEEIGRTVEALKRKADATREDGAALTQLLQAQGASEQKLFEARQQALQDERDQLTQIIDQLLEKKISTDADVKQEQEITKRLKQIDDEREINDAQHKTNLQKQQEDFSKKSVAEQNAELTEKLKILQAFQDSVIRTVNDGGEKALLTEQVRFSRELAQFGLNLDDKNKLSDEKQQLLEQLTLEHNQNLLAIQDNYNIDLISTTQKTTDQVIKIRSTESDWLQKWMKDQQTALEQEKTIGQARVQLWNAIGNATNTFFNILLSNSKKGSQAARNIAVAEKAADAATATIKGILAVQEVLAVPQLVAAYPANIIAAAAMGITTAANVASILAVKIPPVTNSFSVGGRTGKGRSDEAAGIVHKNEWVSPKWMTEHPTYGAIINYLEGARLRGFDSGGFTSPSSAPPLLNDLSELKMDSFGIRNDNILREAINNLNHAVTLLMTKNLKTFVTYTDLTYTLDTGSAVINEAKLSH